MVIVHLNTRIPSYVKRNLIRLRDTFPAHEIVLISNIRQKHIKNVSFKLYEESPDSQIIKNNISHPKEFRENFWHSSIARFAFLRDYQNEIDEAIIHIESDVILSADFPLELFLNNKGLAFPILSRFRGVASVFFSGSKESLSLFVDFIVKEARRDGQITDMTALRKYFDLYPDQVDLLPAGPDGTSEYEPEIFSDLYEIMIAGIQKYSGVFDGSDIGMYLFGTDPRNKLGRTFIGDEIPSTYTRMSAMKFRYNPERDFLDVASNGEWLPIFNLHMTCKDIRLFSNRNLEEIFLNYMKHDSPTELFLPEVYFKMGVNKIVRTIRSLNK